MKLDIKTVAAAANIYNVAAALGINIDDRNNALCPFHGDSKPSMHIYPDGYHCFACGAHGDALDLIQHVKQMTVKEAAEYAASICVIAVQAPPMPHPTHREYPTLDDDIMTRDMIAATLDILKDTIEDLIPYSGEWCKAWNTYNTLLEMHEELDNVIVLSNAKRWRAKHERNEQSKSGARRSESS